MWSARKSSTLWTMPSSKCSGGGSNADIRARPTAGSKKGISAPLEGVTGSFTVRQTGKTTVSTWPPRHPSCVMPKSKARPIRMTRTGKRTLTVDNANTLLSHRALHGAFERLEPDEARVSRPVLRGRGGSNAALLPGAGAPRAADARRWAAHTKLKQFATAEETTGGAY